MDNYLWQPSEKKKANSNLEEFTKFIDFESNKNFKNLWKWSVSDTATFWSKFWDYSKIIGDKG